ncbi:hypothetical protein [Alkalicoccus luteus]|uniref:DUF4352 domain-containing protein n=1 Tax=Alkalicoccus luteus TaxID=1237094 RepID=A0A969TU86_9BACI|nr:hypothetical protein [Alkalicoccus luteus]NJP38453.1 hypothetical protein [Alkalicoccus luteus]
MKKSLGLLSISVILLLVACGEENNVNETEASNNNDATNQIEDSPENNSNNGDNDEEVSNEHDNSNEAANDSADQNLNNEDEEVMEEVQEDGWETEVGETIENEGGTFTLHARQDDIDTIETGPVIMDILQVNTISGELTPDMAELMESDVIDYIQIDVEVQNSSDDDITFYVNQATISTDTGEQLESDWLMSDYLDSDMMANTNHSGSFFFILENSNAEDVNSVRMTWSAPIDEDWNELGEDIDIEISF